MEGASQRTDPGLAGTVEGAVAGGGGCAGMIRSLSKTCKKLSKALEE